MTRIELIFADKIGGNPCHPCPILCHSDSLLDNLAEYRGYPQRLRSDNGPEFIAQALELWAKEHDVTLDFIEPGKPAQNGYIERFNRTYREDILDILAF